MGAFDGSNALKGKVAIITGGARGIGKGMTTALAKAGASVTFTDIKEEILKKTEKELKDQGYKVQGVIADGRSDEAVKNAVKKTVDAFGSVYMVVNNANVEQPFKPLEEVTRADIDDMFEAGYFAAWRYMMAVVPHMKEAGGGSLVNIASDAGLWGNPGMLPYNSCKEAMRAMMRTAAREWGKYSIIANTIIPGALTEGAQAYFDANPGHLENRKKQMLLGRMGIPEDDLGALAVFLCSDGAKYLTGETIKMNGGVNINAL
jgi:NAD(P)-dependent dehydrogenase (short-subunit alcohol dehydrogenase family)